MQNLLFSTPVTDRLLRHYLFSTNWNIATFVFKMCKVEIAVRLKMYIPNLCLQQIFTVKLSKAENLNTDRLFITATPMWESLVEVFWDTAEVRRFASVQFSFEIARWQILTIILKWSLWWLYPYNTLCLNRVSFSIWKRVETNLNSVFKHLHLQGKLRDCKHSLFLT